MRRFYGVPLHDLFTGRLLYTEMAALVAKLPPESAFQTELRDSLTDEQLREAAERSTGHGAWSRTDMMLAAVFDAIGVLTHVQIAKTGTQSDPPQPYPRPGMGAPTTTNSNPQAMAYLQRIRDLHEQGKEPT